jgi:hypothetical protein
MHNESDTVVTYHVDTIPRLSGRECPAQEIEQTFAAPDRKEPRRSGSAMKDYLKGVNKIKSIMNKTTFVCRKCTMSHSTFRAAANCCTKAGPAYRKERI